ncbi:putative effector of murein hydrolase [Acinetobacter baylyi]|uniref:Effector of murein hydrolase n=1 Tax=Acinetobacter baylyi TaxID=202950 RepID=A0ABU0URF0_ACIBI|nr:LrgB family protein [Acinetobacter baylyi]MDQ1207119.1 putative effector of murein hydrolase [Acinetobacter baylyi]MDR6108272.1 putative effector of murein hydrolase [Acinetobacter baylyi]MDR6184136.1 putative effector of murein hydrolase [Acinetobacter baylyi]
MTEFWGLFYLVWTIFCYFLAKRLFVRTQKIYLSPIIVVPVLSIVLISILRHAFEDYYLYTQYLVAMLGPITVAFAVPVFHYRRVIQQHFKLLLLSSSLAMLVGIFSSWFLASLMNFDEIVKNSLLARSISIPFALVLTEKVGGSMSLIPLFTVITGLVGMLFGDTLLLLMRFKNKIACGTALGNAAHAMGIVRARQRDELEGVIASLSMIISGVIMTLFAPLLINLTKCILNFL